MDSHSAKEKIVAELDKLLANENWQASKLLRVLQQKVQALRDETASKFQLDSASLVEKEALAQGKISLGSDEKYVYVRVYHRLMPTLSDKKASRTWLRSVLLLLSHTEKHGLAVYGTEEQARRSLKNKFYAYVTLVIKNTQDVSARRLSKKDSDLDCPLLVIENIDTNNMLKLSHEGKDYNLQTLAACLQL